VKVFNNTDRALPVDRWTIFPKSTRCVNNQGKVLEELPDGVGYGSVIRRLEAQGVVVLPSFGKAKNATPSKESARVAPSASPTSRRGKAKN